jgi:hypothetical protein
VVYKPSDKIIDGNYNNIYEHKKNRKKKFKYSYEVFILNLDNDQFCRPVKTKKKIKKGKIQLSFHS